MISVIKKGRRGFAGMSPEKRRKIASMGGKTAHKRGTAHKWSSEEARRAGKIGGKKRKKVPSYWDNPDDSLL